MNTKSPQVVFIYDRYKKANATTKASVEMRITYNSRQKYISTGIMLYPNQWKKGQITNCADIFQISQTLDKMLVNVRQILLEMMDAGNVDIFSIPQKLKELEDGNITFSEFCIMRASVRKYGKTKDSQERYNRFLRLFNEWGKIQDFEDIKESNIIDYDQYLQKKGMKTYSKWNNYHRFLNSFIIDAIDEGYLQKNPYKWINIPRGKHPECYERFLKPEEFEKIKQVTLSTESLNKVRDVFIFQTYTCLSYVDLRSFSIKKVQEVKGMKVYLGVRQKTKKKFIIPILNPAWEILMKYRGRLPIISNVKYNEYLKVVAQAAGIDKPISSHWARHTGATLLLNEGVDMQIISKICGHSSIRITEQIYAKLLDETVVDALSDIQV